MITALPEKLASLARHALGLPNKRRTSYRNRYVVGDCEDGQYWQILVDSGLARKRHGSTLPFDGDHMFSLTKEGATLALKRGEKLCAEDFPKATT